jgi:hypothetical protein
VFTVVFLATVAAPVVLLAGTSAIASRGNGASVRTNLLRFGYALIPLDIAAFVAHTQADALGEGRNLLTSVGRLVGVHVGAGSARLAAPDTVRTVQWLLVAAGVAVSVHVTWRIAAARHPGARARWSTFLPYGGLVVLLGAVNAVLFAFPAAL